MTTTSSLSIEVRQRRYSMRLEGDYEATQRYMEQTGSSMEVFGRKSMQSFMGTATNRRTDRIQIRILNVRAGSIIIESELSASEELLEEAAAAIADAVGTAYTETVGEQRSWTLLSFEGTTTTTTTVPAEDDDDDDVSVTGEDGVVVNADIDQIAAVQGSRGTFLEENYDWIVALAVFIGGGVVLNFVCVCLWYRCRDKSCTPCSDCREGSGADKPRLFSRDIRMEQKVAIHDDEYETDDDKLPALPEEIEELEEEDNRLIPVVRERNHKGSHETSEIETDPGSDMDVLDRVEYVETAGSGDAKVLLGFRNKESW